MELGVLCWSGHSFNISTAERRWRGKKKKKKNGWWAWTESLSYCNSSQNTKYDMKGRRASSPARCAHQRADRRTTSSFLLILKESRTGTGGWQRSLNRSTLTLPLLSLSFCELVVHLMDSGLGLLFFLFFLFIPLSQLAGKLRPLRVSIDVMSPNRSAFMAPLKLSEVTPQMPAHVGEFIKNPLWSEHLHDVRKSNLRCWSDSTRT